MPLSKLMSVATMKHSENDKRHNTSFYFKCGSNTSKLASFKLDCRDLGSLEVPENPFNAPLLAAG